MIEYPLSYREVIPEQQQSWKEINLNIGGTQSTLQDIKVSERANGYSYRDSTKFHTRNRFIYWRIHHNILDLVEHSFDVNLSGNKIRYKFSDAPILGGICIEETYTHVHVLVPTVCSVHILQFPHPDRLHVPGDIVDVHPDLSVPSIFADVSQANKSMFYVYTNPDSQVPYLAASILTSNHTLFLFAYASGELRIVRNISPDESTTGPNLVVRAYVGETLELRREAKVPRFLSGLADKITKLGVGGGGAGGGGGGRSSAYANPDSVVSIVLHTIGVQTYAIALCHDARILVWNCDKGQCVADSDVIVDCATDRQTIPGAHNHVLQKANHSEFSEFIDNTSTNGILVAFLSFATSSQFHILRPVVSGAQFHLKRICNFDSPMADLVDFSFTPARLWALYRDDIDSQSASVWSICLNNDENSSQNNRWQPIILEPMLPSDEIIINPELDAKQNYLDFIFYPGRFPLNIISKALSIYRRSAILSDMNLSVQNLRQRVCMAVEAEIVHELKEEEVNDDDYQETAYWCWSRFYSCCVQYYITGLRPLGLLLLPSVSGAVLIKKDSFSILRPLDVIEHLALCNEYSYPDQFEHCTDIADAQEDVPDLIKLIGLLVQLNEHLCEDTKRKFDKECFTHSPDNVVMRILPELKESDFNDISDVEVAIKKNLSSTLSSYSNIQQTIHILLTLLSLDTAEAITHSLEGEAVPHNINSSLYPDLEVEVQLQQQDDVMMNLRESESTPSGFPDKVAQESDESDSSGSGGRKYFASSKHDGMGFLSDFRAKGDEREQLMEPARYREMVRVESVCHLFSSPLGVNVVAKVIGQQTELRYSLCRSLLILHTLLLEGEHNTECGDGNSIEMLEAFRAVCLPELVRLVRCYHAQNWVVSDVCATPVLPTDGMMQRFSSLKLTPVYGLKTSNMQSSLLFELFSYSTGGQEAHKQLARLRYDDDTLAHWHLSMLPYAEKLMQLIWPINGNTSLPEWLLVCGQHLRLHQYVSLLNEWCEPRDLSRRFIMALSFLATGEKQKAYDNFLRSSKGVYSEKFIMDRVPLSNADGSAPFILYFLRVINLFEQYGYVDCAMECANSVLTVQDMNITLSATLYSILFKHQLALGHFEKAYHVLIQNPDVERQKDNLRDLVKTLLDKKQLHTLINFEYTGNEDLFCSILHTRAQATDSINNMYYDFLYAFHMKRGMHFIRKAATVMYEQAYRLRQYNSAKALEKQVKCYLAAVNALSLMDPEFAYVIKPAETDENQLEDRQNNLLGNAGMNISDDDREESNELNLTVKENVEVLHLNGIKEELDCAKARLRLAKYEPDAIADHLTSPVELVMLLVNAGLFKPALLLCKRFIIPNDLIFEHLTRSCVQLSRQEDANAWNWLAENDLQELNYIGNTPSDVAWNLLKTFLEEYEKPLASIIHKVIAQKLIEMGYFLPHWFLASYKKLNAAELLRLFYFNGLLEEAVKLAKEYLLAALGHGPEHFGLASGIIASETPFCLPLFTIEDLIDEIDSQNKIDLEKPFEKDHVELQSIFKKYISTITQLTNEKCIHEMSKVRRVNA